MSLGLNFSFGRLLSNTENLTPAKVNAIVKGIIATLTGTVGTTDLDAGAVTPAKTTAGAYFYASGTLSGGTYTSAYTPAIGSYTDGLVLAFKAGSANTGAVNYDAGAGAKPLRKHGGRALITGDIKAGQILEVRYNNSLVAGGCWEVTSLLGHQVADPISYGRRNLINQTTSAALATVTADEILLKNTAGEGLLVTGVNTTINIGAGVGLDGLETGGTEVASHWYHIWLIGNGTAVHGVLEQTSAVSDPPTGPDLSGGAFNGYEFKAYVGSVYNDSGSDFDPFYQLDNEVFLFEPVAMAGTTGSGGFGFLDISTLVPANAKIVAGSMGPSTNDPGEMAIGGSSVSSGITGAQTFNAAAGPTFRSFFAAGMFRVPIAVGQTLQWSGVNTADYRIVLSGYTV